MCLSRLRTARNQTHPRDRTQLCVPGAPVADAVNERDGPERPPALPGGPAEAFEERARADVRRARPRPRREALLVRHRGGQVRALAVVEDEVDGAATAQPVLDDLGPYPPDVSLEAGLAGGRRRPRRGEPGHRL